MHKIKVIAATNISGMECTAVAKWVMDVAREDGGINPEFVDLSNVSLPSSYENKLMEGQQKEPNNWRKTIEESDGFIFILSEYNFFNPSSIKSALDCLYREWNYKPAAFVKYGENTGRRHSTHMLRQAVTALGMMPISDVVNLPFFNKPVGKKEDFVVEPTIIRSAQVMLSELKRWSIAMKSIRSQLN